MKGTFSALVFCMGTGFGVLFAHAPMWGVIVFCGVFLACSLMDDEEKEERGGPGSR